MLKTKKTIASPQDSFNPKYRKYSKLSQDCIGLENEYRKLEQEYSNTEHSATSTDDMDSKLKEKMSELKEESKELDEAYEVVYTPKTRDAFSEFNKSKNELDEQKGKYYQMNSKINDLRQRLTDVIWAGAHLIIGDLNLSITNLEGRLVTSPKPGSAIGPDKVKALCKYVKNTCSLYSTLDKDILNRYTECTAVVALKILNSINTNLPYGYSLKDFIYDDSGNKSGLVQKNHDYSNTLDEQNDFDICRHK